MRHRNRAALCEKPRPIDARMELIGVAGEEENRRAACWKGKSRFTFKARMGRDETAQNGNGNVLCLAAASTRETSRCRPISLRFAGIEICAGCHRPQ